MLSVQEFGLSFDYEMWSGVLQGCLLASIAFLVAFDPALRLLVRLLKAMRLTFACADDVLVVLRDIRELAKISKVVSLVKRASSLELNLDTRR